ncbi:MAG TPA: ABC transporter substrate-binding protein [Terriglobales bacterium]|jgi:ABC-type nitrate/sulfonate/bicarbonate transport system substrate-binding protein|nr:ABC transporter substrate-binding protein [Terriglobales bacterium]
MRIIRKALFISLALFAAGFSAEVQAKTINFASNTPTLSGTLPLIVAQEFGFFAAEGLDVKTVLIRGGPTAMAALVGGGVDYTFVAGVAAVRAIVQNAPMVIISGMQQYMDYTLLGAKGITSVNDLKGKVVGVTGPGGIAEFAAVEGLAKKGLVRDRDYKILYGVGNSPARAQALESGKIQASPFSFLERLELERKGYPVIFDIGEAIPGFPFVVIATGKQKIENDPEGIVALLRGIHRGLDFLKKNPDKVADVVIKKNKFGDPATVRIVVKQFASVYSLNIGKEDIDSLIAATRIETEAKKFGGAEKFFTRQFLIKAGGQGK